MKSWWLNVFKLEIGYFNGVIDVLTIVLFVDYLNASY